MHVLVANSGLRKDAAVADMTLDDWRTVIDINLTGQFLSCREAVRLFRKQAVARDWICRMGRLGWRCCRWLRRATRHRRSV